MIIPYLLINVTNSSSVMSVGRPVFVGKNETKKTTFNTLNTLSKAGFNFRQAGRKTIPCTC